VGSGAQEACNIYWLRSKSTSDRSKGDETDMPKFVQKQIRTK